MNYSSKEIGLIVLSAFPELTYAVKKIMLSDFAEEADFEKQRDFLIKTLSRGVYNKLRADFHDPKFREGVLAKLEKKGIKCVTYFSEDYPENLKNTHIPPIVLYCRGDTSLLKSSCFAVVGSRRTSPKMLAECSKISGQLSKKYTVVSGIAEGADTAALQGALDAGGKVISVLANGLDKAYPACNRALQSEIAEKGLLVTEYLPEELPKPYNFPVRNRIIAGLSAGTLVVSAGLKSGALITAGYAMEYGRDVYAFPYNAGSYSGEGCNALIKKGAYLTENILDILPEFGLDLNTPEKNPLTQTESEVLEAIRELGEAFVPAVAERTGRLPHEIIPVLCSLQIKKRIVGLGGNRYSAI